MMNEFSFPLPLPFSKEIIYEAVTYRVDLR